MRLSSRWLALLAALIVFEAARAEGQASAVDRGVWLAGGTARIFGHRDIGNDTKDFVIDLNPRVGYFVRPHLALTANLQFARGSNELGSGRTLGVGPGLAYYFGGPKSRVLPYLGGRTLFLWSRGGPHDQPADWHDHQWAWVAAGGASFLVARNVGLTAEAFYQWSKVSVDQADWHGENSAEQYGVQFGVTVFAY